MKITINGDITPTTINNYLQKQKDKADKIADFCKKNKIDELSYKDSELEFEFKKEEKQFVKPKPRIETRGGDKNGED